jgi:hypothetical protein
MSGALSHLDDLLSAYVDGQLTVEERAVVDAHVAVCPTCRRELAATRQAKAWVSGLPAAEPPFGFYDRMLRDRAGPQTRRQRWPMRLGAVSFAATACVWFGVLGLASLNGARPSGMPTLSSLFNLHTSVSSRTAEQEVTPAATVRKADSFGLPDQLPGGYRLTELLDRDAGEQARYENGTNVMSVFVTPGAIDVYGFPDGTTIDWVDGQQVYLVPWRTSVVIVAQRGDAVVTIVGPERLPPSMAEQVDPPSPGRSIADRVQAAGKGLLEAFGLR